jgi:hypothetical protein
MWHDDEARGVPKRRRGRQQSGSVTSTMAPPSLSDFYAGIERAHRWYQNVGSTHYGYGNPSFVNSGCHTEGSPLCTTNTNTIMEATADRSTRAISAASAGARNMNMSRATSMAAWGAVAPPTNPS